MILVTSRAKVAMLGSHVIYKVEGTNMIYIPSDKVSKTEEQRYVMIWCIDIAFFKPESHTALGWIISFSPPCINGNEREKSLVIRIRYCCDLYILQ